MTEDKNLEQNSITKTSEGETIKDNDETNSSEDKTKSSENNLKSSNSTTSKEGEQSNEQQNNDDKSPEESQTNKVRVQGASSSSTANRTIERQNMGFNFFSKRFSLHSLGSSFEKKSLSSIPECEEYSTREKKSTQEKANNQHHHATPKPLKPIMKKPKQNGKGMMKVLSP